MLPKLVLASDAHTNWGYTVPAMNIPLEFLCCLLETEEICDRLEAISIDAGSGYCVVFILIERVEEHDLLLSIQNNQRVWRTA